MWNKYWKNVPQQFYQISVGKINNFAKRKLCFYLRNRPHAGWQEASKIDYLEKKLSKTDYLGPQKLSKIVVFLGPNHSLRHPSLLIILCITA